ncbi:hypothetical protein ANCCAN_22411 [Ancylostoma caninum]|uniref:Uncharacterized protein n=1 Tax=Ancylostoma caninum TaxID=29170 RepID=A0A368FHV6_ANCCA|nr:hypothetical protein ANCCAN_22411 [Ancylostoma caninum]
MKTIQQEVNKSVKRVIRKAARNHGYAAYADLIASQVKATVEYDPLKCPAVEEEGTTPPVDYTCIVEDDVVTKIGYKDKRTEDIPHPNQQFLVVLKYKHTGIQLFHKSHHIQKIR